MAHLLLLNLAGVRMRGVAMEPGLEKVGRLFGQPTAFPLRHRLGCARARVIEGKGDHGRVLVRRGTRELRLRLLLLRRRRGAPLCALVVAGHAWHRLGGVGLGEEGSDGREANIGVLIVG